VLQDDDGNIELTHSVSAGLDYAAVGPELASLRDIGRIEFMHASDGEALEAFKLLASTEGILPALESAHGLAGARVLARTMKRDAIMLINLSGRGDKDVHLVGSLLPDLADVTR
jgi:tryptophan synthase beta subunit